MKRPGRTDEKESRLPRLPAQMTAVCLSRSAHGSGRHGVYRVDTGGGRFVLKCFDRKRGRLQEFFGRLENRLAGRSAPDALTRYRTEKKTLAIWRENGFAVFRRPPDLPHLALDRPHLALEYVPGRTLKAYLADGNIRLEAKLATLKQFIAAWGRRHALAVKTANPLLIHEHATFQHVWRSDDGRLIFYDFETAYTSGRRMPDLVGREIAGYLRSVLNVLSPADYERFLQLVIREYPHPEFLDYPCNCFFRHPNPLIRLLTALDRRRPRNRRLKSKYNVTLRFEDFRRRREASAGGSDRGPHKI